MIEAGSMHLKKVPVEVEVKVTDSGGRNHNHGKSFDFWGNANVPAPKNHAVNSSLGLAFCLK